VGDHKGSLAEERLSRTVLYLHPHFTLPGGAGRHALETGRELARRGWKVHIASIRNSPQIVSDFYNEITFHDLGGPLSSSIWYWPNLPILFNKTLKLIDDINPDIVFSQVFPANWWGFGAKLLRKESLRHIWMCQEPSAFIHSKKWISALPMNAAGIGARALNPILKAVDTHLARHTDFVFANSEFSKSLALAAYNYRGEKLGICYPGVDTVRFSPSPETQKTNFKFITCARLTKFKNIDKIIRALTSISDERVTLTVIGRGEEYDSLVSLTADLNLVKRVTFLQTVSDPEMIEQLRTSYGLIHAAEEEPFGLTPVEAMACGTPVIAMRGGGPAETVLHEETGYLCHGASPEAIASAMKWLIEREPDYPKMSTACVKRAERFTWKMAADSLEEVFTQTLHSPPPKSKSC
jgi:glycosyltransferase involved in cell wall biosynthesis